MNYYKELLYTIIEMCFSIFIIFFGYTIWNNFDQTEYNIAKYYDNTKEVQISYDSNIIDNSNNTVVSIHNVSDKVNNKDIILKINKENKVDNIRLDINTINYNLNDLYIKEDEYYNYYLIENIDLVGYETKTYFINIINNNLINDYDFITEL